MDVTPLVKQGAQIIQSYAGGKFKVSGQVYSTPVIVSSEFTQEWKTKRIVSEIEKGGVSEGVESGFVSLRVKDFSQVVELSQSFDVFLCGSGSEMKFLPPDVKTALKEQGVSIDIMDTGAACRTYNVLMAEGRRVLAALLLS